MRRDRPSLEDVYNSFEDWFQLYDLLVEYEVPDHIFGLLTSLSAQFGLAIPGMSVTDDMSQIILLFDDHTYLTVDKSESRVGVMTDSGTIMYSTTINPRTDYGTDRTGRLLESFASIRWDASV